MSRDRSRTVRTGRSGGPRNPFRTGVSTQFTGNTADQLIFTCALGYIAAIAIFAGLAFEGSD